jgi:hypothetical protein
VQLSAFGLTAQPNSIAHTSHSAFNEQQTYRQMVDASTQYSPPTAMPLPLPLADFAPSGGKGKDLSKMLEIVPTELQPQLQIQPQSSAKPDIESVESTQTAPGISARVPSDVSITVQGSSKRARPPNAGAKIMPIAYENCDVKDLALLISNMLMELIRFNDEIPLKDGRLTRFHSRAPPGISVADYLQRLTTHATLSPPILLSMVYYIDRLCALYPAFTISSLTVHRFLIASATVASKGLSDSFWTNTTYARVGGVSLKELALLELEFLRRVEWKIVPRPEVLVDYYRSLVERNDGYVIEGST